MISTEERKKMLQADSIGPTIVNYLEIIGVETLAELKDESAEELIERICDALNKGHMRHKLAYEALENLISHANNYC